MRRIGDFRETRNKEMPCIVDVNERERTYAVFKYRKYAHVLPCNWVESKVLKISLLYTVGHASKWISKFGNSRESLQPD